MIMPIAIPSTRAIVTLLGLGIGLPCFFIFVSMLAGGKIGRPVFLSIVFLVAIPTLVMLFSILKHQEIHVIGSNLTIKTSFYRESVSLDDIKGPVVLVSLHARSDLRPALRLNGIGLPGYSGGWFRLRNGSKAFVALTRDDAVLLNMNSGYSLIFSLQEPDAMQLLRFLADRRNTHKE